MAVKALSRSASQPVVFPSGRLLEKRIKQLTKGSGLFAGGSGSQKQEDDLDIIKQIIETDVAMSSADSCVESEETLRSQSLTHIPGQFPQTAGSLPSLPHAESMHILHANYNSAPDFMQFGKSCISNFDGMPMGPEGGVREMGHILRRDSQQRPSFPRDDFQPSSGGFSSLTGQDELMGDPPGGVKGLGGSRRNSMYDNHSAVGTPVLTNSAQSTPQGIGLPFDFPLHRNSHLPGYNTENRNSLLRTGGFGPESLRQPGATAPNIPNTFHYIVASAGGEVECSDSDRLLGRLQGEDGGGQLKEDAQLLSDYLVSGSMEVGGAKQEEVGGIKQERITGGGLELSSLKG